MKAAEILLKFSHSEQYHMVRAEDAEALTLAFCHKGTLSPVIVKLVEVANFREDKLTGREIWVNVAQLALVTVCNVPEAYL